MNGQTWKGYYLVATMIVASAGGAIWHAEHVLGYAAVEAKATLWKTKAPVAWSVTVVRDT